MTDRDVERHYARGGDIVGRMLAALAAAGKDPGALTAADLAAVDQFHIRGHVATLELADLAGLRSGMAVLDVGSGLGGPARTLAAEFGARVTGIDLTADYVAAATALTARVGLADRAVFRQASALDLPFGAAAFDLAWTQHVAMNIADKQRLYAEMARVLKPGGRLALYDVVAGPAAGADGRDLHFPVPWAGAPELSHLIAAAAVRRAVEAAGFATRVWRDMTAPAVDWFREMRRRREQAGGPPAMGLHILLGAVFPNMADNMLRNLEEGRIEVIQGVFAKPMA